MKLEEKDVLETLTKKKVRELVSELKRLYCSHNLGMSSVLESYKDGKINKITAIANIWGFFAEDLDRVFSPTVLEGKKKEKLKDD